MVAVDIALVVIVVAGIVAGVSAVSSNRVQKRALKAAPDHRLSTAMRLIDRIIQSDDAGFANLPEPLRKEAERLVTEYYEK